MQPYRPIPDVPAVPAWYPSFGSSPWAFSSRANALLSRRELVGLMLAVIWADQLTFGALSAVHAPRFELVLAGWLGLLLVQLGRPRSWRIFAQGLTLAALALTASAWRGGLGLALLACSSLLFVPAAARLRTFSALEPLGSVLTFALLAVPRGVSASWRRTRATLTGRNVGALPWLEASVALGLLLAFGSLFVLANPFVRETASAVLSALLDVFGRFDALGRRALGVFAFGAMFCGLLRSVPGTMLITSHEVDEATVSARMSRMAVMTLVLQNALFGVYNAIDAVFLGARVAPPGMTLQAYAHDGALWLTVTLFFVTVVAYAFRGAARTGTPLVRKLMTAWLVQGLLLGANVFFRLALHVHASGLSDARFVGAFGAAAVVGGLLVVWRAIRLGHTRAWIVRAQATVLAGAVTAYALLPTALLSARYDVRAVQRGARLPLVHVAELGRSAESAPSLLGLLGDDDPIVREGVAGTLLQHHWRSMSVAGVRANQHIDGPMEERMREMLRGSDPLRALADMQTSSRAYADHDALLVDAAVQRFQTYVHYMDDQDAVISPRLPENGTLLIPTRSAY